MTEGKGDEKWSVPCSDEEGDDSNSKLDYSPSPGEIIRLYESLDSNGPLSIKWNWPYGRRQPSNPSNTIEEEDEEMLETRPEEKSDFDFTDEASTPVLRKERQSGPKGSAKKKTTSLSGVISNMRRFRQQERLEKEQSLQSRSKR